MTTAEAYSKAIVEITIAIQKLTPLNSTAKAAKGTSGSWELGRSLEQTIAQLDKAKKELQAGQKRYGL